MDRAWKVSNSGGAHYGIGFWCEGCEIPHVVATSNGSEGPNGWDWNGSLELPTLSPSILVNEHVDETGVVRVKRCHSFVKDGQIQYLGDCGHSLAGTTRDLTREAD